MRRYRIAHSVRFVPLLGFAAICQFLSGCQIRENTVWNNSLDPANPKVDRMVLVEGGRFQMGSGSTKIAHEDEVAHEVDVSSFLLDSVPVTQAEYARLMGSNPSSHTPCLRCPVEMVEWFDAVRFCNARSKSQGLDTVYEWPSKAVVDGKLVDSSGPVRRRHRNGYRLPTEAEWELAARGDTNHKWFWGNDSVEGDLYAWSGSNSQFQTHPVGQKMSNRFGLRDMVGNVWEWLDDWYGPYDLTVAVDPAGPGSGREKCMRGGSFASPREFLASTNRGQMTWSSKSTEVGFRCARSLVP